MKSSPGFTNAMTECLLKRHVDFPSLEEKSVTESTSRCMRLSAGGNQVLNRLLILLPSYLQPSPTARISLFPPRLLLSICDALQLARLDSATKQNDAPVLPSVLSKLRDWRLLDLEYRFSPGAIHKLALDLAGIIKPFSSFSSDLNQTSHVLLRLKWVPYDSPSESQEKERTFSAPSSPSSPRSGVLYSPQECVHDPDPGERRFDATHTFCQTRGTPDSEDASVVVSRRHHGSRFRSGCSACRHPRVSGPSTPSSPHMTIFEPRMPFLDTVINTCAASSRHRKSTSVQHKKAKRERHISTIAHNDENEPPLSRPMNLPQANGISFPRQRTHSPRVSNVRLSWEPFSSVQRRLELNHLFHRPREGDKHTSSHCVASVDLRLPITGTNHLLRSPNPASPIDFHAHTPTRAARLSHSQVNSHELGSVAARVPPQPSNQRLMGSRSDRRLPSWSVSHHGRPRETITTMSSVQVNPLVTGSASSPTRRAKGRVQTLLPFQPSRLSTLSVLPSDLGVKRCDSRSALSTQTHEHARSDGTLFSSPFSSRKV